MVINLSGHSCQTTPQVLETVSLSGNSRRLFLTTYYYQASAQPQTPNLLLICSSLRLNTSQLATTLFAAFIRGESSKDVYRSTVYELMPSWDHPPKASGGWANYHHHSSLEAVDAVYQVFHMFFSTSYAWSYKTGDLKPQAPRFANICRAAFVFTRTFGLQMPHNNINIPSEQRMSEASKSPGTKLFLVLDS